MFKRLFDVSVALPLLVLVSPILALLALLVRVNLGPPVIFSQTRPGWRGREFVLYKFRTMRNDRSAGGKVSEDEHRLTSFGRWLRATSLDELPELLCVLKGEMSLVGPRPLLVEYLPLYTPFQMRRHEVRPGITGWAQVNGRNAVNWEERLAMDVWYVDHVSFLLDLRILVLTLWKSLVREGINQPGSATMEKFRGSAKSD